MTSKSLTSLIAFIVVFSSFGASLAQVPTPFNAGIQLVAPQTHVSGDRLPMQIEGLPAGALARITATRRFGRWMQGTNNNWVEVLVLLESWAEFRVPRSGRVDLNSDRPVRGTWRRADARDLLWSGERVESYGKTLPTTGSDVLLRVTVGGNEVAAKTLVLSDGGVGLVRTTINEPGFSAAYAAPQGTGPYPITIVLHGSEGGDRDMASIGAARFASRGYATLALNYFARPHKGMTNIPTEHIELPIELVERARSWLAMRPEADLSRVGIWGVSKGAEFAALAASQFDWIDAAVACVASDVVWEGYGREPAPVPPLSS
jgi:Acyl-CoA thioester hydrolase/BAAT N-terminal region/BAAT / Acyl-CoA thioester hydrolase C terminal